MYVIQRLGWVVNLPMGGQGPITDQQIYHYAQNRCIKWETWEPDTLLDMSAGFLSEMERGKRAFAKSPLEIYEAAGVI